MQTLWLDFSLAARNIARQRRRSAIAIGAVAFGIAALILASGFIEWIFLDFRESTIRSQLGHIQIVRRGYHDAGKANPYAFLLPEAVPLQGTGNPQGDIKTVAPRLSFSGLISHGDSTISFIGDGVSPQAEAAFGKGLQMTAGRNLTEDDPSSAIVGEGLARNLGIGVGDRVVLLATTAAGSTNAVELTVRGMFTTVTKAYDDSALRVPLVTARMLLRTKGSHVWIVLLNETARTDAMVADIRAQLPQDQLEVVPWYQLADVYNKTATLFTRQIQGVRIIIAVIILLSISNTMATSVMERVGEIGTSMALGTKRRGIMRLFLCEGILLGCIGGVTGLALGGTFAAIISAIGVPMPPPPGMAHGFTGEILVTWDIAFQSLLLSVSTTLAASMFPAWRASRMEIVNALRHNR